MQVGPRTVVTVEYTLTDDDGEVLDSTEGEDPLEYLHGVGQIVPGLEQALEGKAAGESVTVVIEAADGYGEHDPALVQIASRDQFRGIPDLEVGMQFQANDGGEEQVVTVIGVEDDQITLDANHPLAGMTLHFDVEVIDVRVATLEELQHGHPHGPGDDH